MLEGNVRKSPGRPKRQSAASLANNVTSPTKSAGKIRRRASSYISKTNAPHHHPPTIDHIDDLSQEERNEIYDYYQATGVFENDLVYLCRLIDIKVTVSRRLRMPPTTDLQQDATNSDVKTNIDNTLPEEATNERPIKVEITIERDDVENGGHKKNKKKEKGDQNELDPGSDNDLVKEMFIRGWKIDLPVINVLSRTLPYLHKLISLNLWNVGLEDDSLYCLGQCLTLTPSLQKLCLDGNNFVLGQRFHVFLREPSQLNLKHFSLRHCNLNQIGALYLADALSDNKSLLTLNLCFNKLGDEGVRHIANSLRMNRCLLSLNMASNGIGDEGAKFIANAVSTFPLTYEETVSRREHLLLAKDEEEELKSSATNVSSKNQRSTGKTKTQKKKDKSKDTRSRSNSDKAKSHTKPSDVIASSNTISPDHDPYKFKNPLLEETRLVNGELWVPGNRCLINLNLSRNQISKDGLESLHRALKYQDESVLQSEKIIGSGLMRLSLQKNSFRKDDETYATILQLLQTRDPVYNKVTETLE